VVVNKSQPAEKRVDDVERRADELEKLVKIDKVEKKVQELEEEIEKSKESDNPPNTPAVIEAIKHEAEDLTTEPTKSPRKMLTIFFIAYIVLLIFGIIALFFTSNVFLWLLVAILLTIILLTDKLR